MATSSANALDALTGKACTCLDSMGTALSLIRAVVRRVRGDIYKGVPGWQHLPEILRHARDGQQRIVHKLDAIRELDEQHDVLELVRQANLDDAPEFLLRPGLYRTWTEAVPGCGAVPGIAGELLDDLRTISDCENWNDLTDGERIDEVRKILRPWRKLTPDFANRWNLRIQLECDRAIQLEWHQTIPAVVKSDAEPESPRDDGPFGTDGFRWDGNEYLGIRPGVYRLVEFLWGAKDRTARFDELAEPVFRDHARTPAASEVGSLRRDANRFFRTQGIPFAVTLSGEKVTLIATAAS